MILRLEVVPKMLASKASFELAHLEQLLIKNHDHQNSLETLHKTYSLFLISIYFQAISVTYSWVSIWLNDVSIVNVLYTIFIIGAI